MFRGILLASERLFSLPALGDGPMHRTSGDKRKRRMPHDPPTGAGTDQEPTIPGDAEGLDDDQADSGPDRDHKELAR